MHARSGKQASSSSVVRRLSGGEGTDRDRPTGDPERVRRAERGAVARALLPPARGRVDHCGLIYETADRDGEGVKKKGKGEQRAWVSDGGGCIEVRGVSRHPRSSIYDYLPHGLRMVRVRKVLDPRDHLRCSQVVATG
jgi:hypothetical protein